MFTIAVGHARYVEQALGLARSLALVGDRTPRVLVTDVDHPDVPRWFDRVVPPPPTDQPYLLKLAGLDVTEEDHVLFLDSDMITFGRLDPIFDYFANAAFGARGERITSGHWYGQVADYLPKLGLTGIPMINGGMVAYGRTDASRAVLAEARRVADAYPTLGLEAFRGKVPDEPCMAIAMERTGLGVLAPDDTQFMNTGFGIVGPIELDVMRRRCRYLQRGRQMRLKTPLLFHAATFVNYVAYWRELDKLKRLETAPTRSISDKERMIVKERLRRLA